MEDRETIIRSVARICCAAECGTPCKECGTPCKECGASSAWVPVMRACLAAAEAGGWKLTPSETAN